MEVKELLIISVPPEVTEEGMPYHPSWQTMSTRQEPLQGLKVEYVDLAAHTDQDLSILS